MVKTIKLLLLFLFLSPVLHAQQRTCQDVLSTAESFMIDGNYENVRKVLNQTRATCSKDVSWYYIQFGYHAGVNQVDSALLYMTTARKLFPKNDSIHFLFAQTCLMQYDSAMAVKGIDAIEQAMSIRKKTAYQVCLTQLLDASGQTKQALEVIKEVPGAEKNYDALVQWAVLLQKSNKPKDALIKLNQAIKLNRYDVLAYLQKADLFFNALNRQDDALMALDTVEMLDSTLADPMLMRAAFFESHEDYDNAIAEYDEAIQTDSSVHEVYLFRGGCLKEIKEFDLAEEDYKTYKKKNPNDKEINYLVAELYIAKGDYVAAAQLMSQMETNGETAYELYLIRGIAQNDNGQYDNALKDFNRAENFKERDERLYYNRGVCYFNKEDYRKAKYDFEKAKYMEPGNMENFYMHCRASYHAGFFDEACESCKTAKFHGYEAMDKIYMKGCK